MQSNGPLHQVSIDADIKALCLDLATQNVHTFTSQRKVLPRIIKKTSTAMSTKPHNHKCWTTGVQDVLLEGMVMLTERACLSIGYSVQDRVGQTFMQQNQRKHPMILWQIQHLTIRKGAWRWILVWILNSKGNVLFQMQISAQRMSVNKIDLLDDCKVENTLKGE